MPRIVFIAIAAIAVIAAAIVGRSLLPDGPAKVQQVGRVNIGGPFTLTDHTGKRVTEKDFAGKYMLVYFGYTFCPDVCPTSLSIVAEALAELSADELDKVVPIFITVDPERDNVEVMESYVPNFHDKMVGLTGSVDEVKAVSKAYKAYYAKVNTDDPDGNYAVDHSSFTYLMGPDGEYVVHFNHGTPYDIMAKKLAEIL